MAVRPSRGRAGQGGRWGAPLLTCMLSCDLHRKRRRPPKGSGSHQGAVPGVTAGQARPALRQAVLLLPSGQPPASWSRVSSTPPSHPARPTPLLTPSWSSCSTSSEPLAHMIPACPPTPLPSGPASQTWSQSHRHLPQGSAPAKRRQPSGCDWTLGPRACPGNPLLSPSLGSQPPAVGKWASTAGAGRGWGSGGSGTEDAC